VRQAKKVSHGLRVSRNMFEDSDAYWLVVGQYFEGQYKILPFY
jgi:hypothetical protein